MLNLDLKPTRPTIRGDANDAYPKVAESLVQLVAQSAFASGQANGHEHGRKVAEYLVKRFVSQSQSHNMAAFTDAAQAAYEALMSEADSDSA